MHLSSIPPLISAILFCFLGIYCYLKNKRSKVNFSFALMCFTIFWWQGSWTILFNTEDPKIASILVRIGYSGIIFLPVTLYHFAIEFLNRKKEKKLVWLSYAVGIGFLISLWTTNLFIRGYYIFYWGYYPKASVILHPAFLVILTTQALRVLYLFYLYSRNPQIDLIKRNQYKYMFWGVLFYAFAIADFADNYGLELYPLGFIPVLIFTAIIAYSIIAHQLMDITIVIQKTVIYSILASIIAIIFNLSIILFEHIFQQTIGYKTFPITLLVALFIAILFQPLFRWLSSIVDKLFFKGSLPKLAKDLQQAEKLAILASGLAHDIKNPLAPIKTYIQNLPNNLNNPAFIDKITRAIPAEVDKITDIINQLRDFAAPPPLSVSKVNIHNLIDKKLGLFEQDFSSKNITVEKHYSPALPEINADPIQLERVFLNLFLNAIDAMPNGGKLTISTEIVPKTVIASPDKIGAKQSPTASESISIKVSDTGIGIEKKDLPHIFEPFYSKGKHKGIGIGLAVVQQIIKEHGGSVQVTSIQWKYTTFTVSIPIGKNI